MNPVNPLSDRAKGARTAVLAERYALALVGIEAALVGLHTVFGQHAFFNMDREYNLSSWFSGLQLFAISGACVAAFHRDSRIVSGRWLWWILAVGCCYLSFDEIMAIHERVREDTLQGLPAGSLLRRLPPWQIVFAPALAVTALTFSSIFASRFADRPACWVPAAIGLSLWGGAFAFDGASMALFTPAGLYDVEVALEEFMEMAGATLILLGVVRYVSSVECHIGPVVPPWKRRFAWGVPVTVVFLLPVATIVAVNSHAGASVPSATGRHLFPTDRHSRGIGAFRHPLLHAPHGGRVADTLALLEPQIRPLRPEICLPAPDRARVLLDSAAVARRDGPQ